jgi:hypothetical protein
MTFIKTSICTLSLLALMACQKPGDQFIGRWSNQWTGGNMILSIERNGETLLLRETIASSGNVIFAQEAKVQDGFLMIEDTAFFKKLAYVKEEDAIAPLGVMPALPMFRRLK